MPKSDNIYYYVAYGLILLTFYIVMKTPKKDKNKQHEDDEKNEKN